MKNKKTILLIASLLLLTGIYAQEKKVKLARDVSAVSYLAINTDTFLFSHQFQENKSDGQVTRENELMIKFTWWSNYNPEEQLKRIKDTTLTITIGSAKEWAELLSINNYFQVEGDYNSTHGARNSVLVRVFGPGQSLFMKLLYNNDEYYDLLLDYILKNHFNSKPSEEVFTILKKLGKR